MLQIPDRQDDLLPGRRVNEPRLAARLGLLVGGRQRRAPRRRPSQGVRALRGPDTARGVARRMLEAHPVVDGIVLVVPEGWEERTSLLADDLCAGEDRRRGAGGATRADSVRQGLDAVPDSAALVLVHDAARPLADRTLVDRVPRRPGRRRGRGGAGAAADRHESSASTVEHGPRDHRPQRAVAAFRRRRASRPRLRKALAGDAPARPTARRWSSARAVASSPSRAIRSTSR